MGWPPVRSYRKNTLQQKKEEQGEGSGMYVKVSMAGAPYLRKIDLNVYKSYPELLKALGNMFKCTFGKNLEQVLNNLLLFFLAFLRLIWHIYVYVERRNKVVIACDPGEYSEREGYNGSEYAPTYEDKDGDWMLVGDVPWK